MIEETDITRSIIEGSVEDLLDNVEVDVAIAGGGPSGLVAAKYLADEDLKVALFERKLSLGGGMWGGGMLYPKIVVQEQAREILDEFNIDYKEDREQYIASSIESVAKLISNAADSGASLFNCITVEDVIIREKKINGFVINQTPIEMAGLHVDPLAIKSKFCIEATGHPLEVCHTVVEKVGDLNTSSGKIEGEKSMWSHRSEGLVEKNTTEVYPGLYVTGMAANAVHGSPRMGPIFGGMLLSGRKVARDIAERLK